MLETHSHACSDVDHVTCDDPLLFMLIFVLFADELVCCVQREASRSVQFVAELP